MKRARAGFTLAEVAVTLVIVGIGLVLVLEGLTNAKLSAAETHHRKLARELGLLTLGRLESGLFWEELGGGSSGTGSDALTGSYAEEGHEEFTYELVLGDQQFVDTKNTDPTNPYHDSWQAERDRQDRLDDKKKSSDTSKDVDQATEPFQKVRIRVTFPRFGERPNQLVLERWMPWEQVYGSKSGDDKKSAAKPAGEEQP